MPPLSARRRLSPPPQPLSLPPLFLLQKALVFSSRSSCSLVVMNFFLSFSFFQFPTVLLFRGHGILLSEFCFFFIFLIFFFYFHLNLHVCSSCCWGKTLSFTHLSFTQLFSHLFAGSCQGSLVILFGTIFLSAHKLYILSNGIKVISSLFTFSIH